MQHSKAKAFHRKRCLKRPKNMNDIPYCSLPRPADRANPKSRILRVQSDLTTILLGFRSLDNNNNNNM